MLSFYASKSQDMETMMENIAPDQLRQIINQWNINRLDLFELSEPNEVSVKKREVLSKFSLSQQNGVFELSKKKAVQVNVRASSLEERDLLSRRAGKNRERRPVCRTTSPFP